MRVKAIVGPALVCILIICPFFAAGADTGTNPAYRGFSCEPISPVKIGEPIKLGLVTVQNQALKNGGVEHIMVSVWTYGDIEYRGPMSFEIELNDSIPSVFPFTVLVRQAENPDSLTWAGVTFTLTNGSVHMTMSSYFLQFEGWIDHSQGEPQEANWARLGVPEWAKRPPRGREEFYTVDSVTGRLKKRPPKLGPDLSTLPVPPDTGYTRIDTLTKEEAALSKMRRMERHPLEDEDRQIIEIGGVWYERNRGEYKFRRAEVITDVEEYMNKRREESLRRKSRVILDLRDSLSYRNAVRIVGEDKLEQVDSTGFYEATTSGYQALKLQEAGITVRRIRSRPDTKKK